MASLPPLRYELPNIPEKDRRWFKNTENGYVRQGMPQRAEGESERLLAEAQAKRKRRAEQAKRKRLAEKRAKR